MTALTAPPATSCPSGTTLGPPTALGTNKDTSSTRAGMHLAGISSNPMAVQVKDTTMSIPAAATPAMEPKTAPTVNTLLTCLQSRVQTPYNVDGWQESLIASDLVHKYPILIEQLIHSFRVRAPTITQSFTPPNNPSINIHCDAFNDILHKEFMKEHYIGPFTQSDLESIIGPFQSSPLHIIPKPGRPGKFHLIQNLSHPSSPQLGDMLSINSQVNSALFPCEWSMFHTACALVRDLPPGSQGVTRDIAEAYRTILLHPSQWPVLIVHIADEPPLFTVDTSLCFSYGHLRCRMRCRAGHTTSCRNRASNHLGRRPPPHMVTLGLYC